MDKTTLETIDSLLEGVLEETDDSDIRYKVRSARQLVEIVKERHRRLAEEQIGDVIDDEDLLEELSDLGYVEGFPEQD